MRVLVRTADPGKPELPPEPSAAVAVVNLDADGKANLGIAYKPFKVEIADVDVVLVFADGSRIIIPGMALAAFSGRKPIPSVHRQGVQRWIRPWAWWARSASLDSSLQLNLSSADATKQSDEAKQGAGVQPEDSAQAQAAAAAKEENEHKSDAEGKALTEKISNTPPQCFCTAGRACRRVRRKLRPMTRSDRQASASSCPS